MHKEQFRVYFHRALDRAAAAFATVCHFVPNRPIYFEVHAPGPAGSVVNETQALDSIFVSEDLFYKVIDVGLIQRADKTILGFIRVSGHPPCPFEETLNPQDLGPFKLLEPFVRET